MRTIGELKKAIADLPDTTPISFNHMADDGTSTSMRIAEAWSAQGTYCVEFETRVTEVPSETL
jgi:hypothetical protein